MQLKDVMTHNVECIAPDASLKEAALQMKALDFGSLPVCDQDRLIGMITDRDIAVRAVAVGMDPNQARVRECMTDQLIYCFEDEDVSDAAQIMEDNQIRRLPILSHDKKLVGIISLGDLATRVRDDELSGEVLERVSEPVLQHV
jgi:CBS domain-containing protein